MFARFQCGDGHLGVQVIGRADIDQADRVIADGFLPIRRRVPPSPAVAKIIQLRFVASRDGVHDRQHRHVEEFPHLQERVAVRSPHEFLTDEADVDRGFRHFHFPR